MRFLFTPLLCLFLILPGLASAQFGGDESGKKTVQFGQKNTELTTIIQLQYQMQMLKRLIEHERAVNQVLASSVGIGITDPIIPKPEKSLCAIVPANIPCAEAYNDLYDHFSVEKKIQPVNPPSIASASIPSLDGNALPNLPTIPANELSADASTLYWTDITCMSNACSAVVSPNPSDPGARYRIRIGEKLPDGSTISAISASGVSILRGKKTVQLEPAPQA